MIESIIISLIVHISRVVESLKKHQMDMDLCETQMIPVKGCKNENNGSLILAEGVYKDPILTYKNENENCYQLFAVDTLVNFISSNCSFN